MPQTLEVPVLVQRRVRRVQAARGQNAMKPITEFQLGYIGLLRRKVGCPIPFPELLSMEEVSWLIAGLRIRLFGYRKYMFIRNSEPEVV